MKFPVRKLKFCPDSLVGRPNQKIEDKISKNFTPTQKLVLAISKTCPTTSLKSCQKTFKYNILYIKLINNLTGQCDQTPEVNILG